MLDVKKLIVKILQQLSQVDSLTLTTTSASSISAIKFGKVVTLTIQNVRNAPAGNSVMATLPAGWRPEATVYFLITSTDYARRLRVNVGTNGSISIYNYSSAISNTDTNATTSFTFVVA